MILRLLKLSNFRNFSGAKLIFSPLTILVGDNAQGKTNILESISFLAATRSLRAEKESQLIKQGESYCRVEGEIEESYELGDPRSAVSENSRPAQNSEPRTKLEIAMRIIPETEDKVEKRVKVNGVPRRTMDYVGNLVVVYFSPEDINLVTGSPSLRRDYLDLTLSQIDREHKRTLRSYNDTLTSRNKLLKKIREGEGALGELTYWTEQLIKLGSYLTAKREQFFAEVNKELEFLNEGQYASGKLYLSYEKNIISAERSKQYLPREVAAAASLIGPHRDNFIFQLNGHDLAFFGSRGEQRTAVLELKLSELAFVKKALGSSPVLLLDDVFSELDELHREYVISVIGSQQTILSAVEIEKLPAGFLKSAQVVKIEKGKLV